MYRVWDFLSSYTWTLAAGALLAMLGANLLEESYSFITSFPLWFGTTIGMDAGLWLDTHGARFDVIELGDITRVVTLTTLVNNVFMAAFVFLAAKELWEALVLDHGSLRGAAAITPLLAAAGGVAVPAVMFLLLDSALSLGAARAWAVPTATDIAIAYVIGRLIFGPGHRALRLLLLVAVIDDAFSMLILGVFHAPGPLEPFWIIVALGVALGAYLLCNRLPLWLDRDNPMKPAQTRMRLRLGLIPYALAGIATFAATARSGLNPVLGLLPIVPIIPHADRAFGVFSDAERHLHDLLNRAEQWLRYPIGAILFLFAFCNAGAPLAQATSLTAVVAVALVLGKPLGIGLGCRIAARIKPVPLTNRDMIAMGLAAASGFTLSLLFADAAALPLAQTEALRLGVLAAIAVIVPAALLLRR